nr:hypothetical protein [Tanacetum cinerariifolium]
RNPWDCQGVQGGGRYNGLNGWCLVVAEVGVVLQVVGGKGAKRCTVPKCTHAQHNGNRNGLTKKMQRILTGGDGGEDGVGGVGFAVVWWWGWQQWLMEVVAAVEWGRRGGAWRRVL